MLEAILVFDSILLPTLIVVGIRVLSKNKADSGYGIRPKLHREQIMAIVMRLAFNMRFCSKLKTFRFKAISTRHILNYCQTEKIVPNISKLYLTANSTNDSLRHYRKLPSHNGNIRLKVLLRELVLNTNGEICYDEELFAYINFFNLICPLTRYELLIVESMLWLCRFEYIDCLLSRFRHIPKDLSYRLRSKIEKNLAIMRVIESKEIDLEELKEKRYICTFDDNICSQAMKDNYIEAFAPMRITLDNKELERELNKLLCTETLSSHLRLLSAHADRKRHYIILDDVFKGMCVDPLLLAEVCEEIFSYKLRLSFEQSKGSIDKLAYPITLATIAIKTCKRALWSKTNRSMSLLILNSLANSLNAEGLLCIKGNDVTKNVEASLYFCYAVMLAIECERDAKYKLKLKGILSRLKEGLINALDERKNLLNTNTIYCLSSLCGLPSMRSFDLFYGKGISSGLQLLLLFRQALGLELRVKDLRIFKREYDFIGDYNISFSKYYNNAILEYRCLGLEQPRVIVNNRTLNNLNSINFTQDTKILLEY